VILTVVSGSEFPLLSLVWQTTLFASKTPAHTTPAEVTLTAFGLEDVYVIVGGDVIAVLLEFNTDTLLNCATSPCRREKLVGVVVIDAGVLVFVEVLLL
jgi:hypothetical protein